METLDLADGPDGKKWIVSKIVRAIRSVFFHAITASAGFPAVVAKIHASLARIIFRLCGERPP